MLELSDAEHTLIQSYVARRWFVSTAYRQSSAALNPCWYYETIVWEWDQKTRKRGNLIFTDGGSSAPVIAMRYHAKICEIMLGGVENLESVLHEAKKWDPSLEREAGLRRRD